MRVEYYRYNLVAVVISKRNGIKICFRSESVKLERKLYKIHVACIYLHQSMVVWLVGA